MKKCSTVVLFFLFFTVAIFSNDKMKEFGTSVVFSENCPSVKIGDLRGKAVIIIFFQAYSFKGAKWKEDKFRAVDNAFSKNRNVVLMAIKTDGGGAPVAYDYMKTKVNAENWIIGADTNGTYYKEFAGADEYFQYAILNGKGELVKKGYFREDNVESQNFSNGYFTKLFLPADKTYNPKLNKAVKAAEAGAYKFALVSCRAEGKNKETLEDAKALESDIFTGLKDKINGFSKTLKDETQMNRFPDFQELRHFAEALQGVTIQSDAVALYNELKAVPFFKKEINAETAYLAYKKNVEVIKKSDVDKFKETTKATFKESYSGTYYDTVLQKELSK
jgi:hypothetical protein